MYSIYLDQQRTLDNEKRNHALKMINATPIVFNNEQAEDFVRGVKALSGLGTDEIEKLKNLSVAELTAYWGDSDEQKKIKAAVSLMAKALKATNDAILGTGEMNESLSLATHAKEKSFHAVGNVDLGKAVLDLATLNNAYSRPEIDAGWMGLYTMFDARGRNEVRVSDVIGFLRWYELALHEQVILTAIGDRTGDTIGQRRFGGGFQFDTYDMQNNVYSVNQIITGLRNAASDMKSVVAYRELCIDQGLSYPASTKFTGTSGTRDGEWARTNNNIHALNEAIRKMQLNALQIVDGKKANKRTEGTLPVTATTPIVALYNPKHAEEIDRMRRMTGGDDGTNSRLLYNIQFQMSYLVPVSGGYTYTENGKERDEWGIFGKVTESGSKESFGVRLILPGMRNVFVMYKDLEFGQDTRFGTQSTVVGAFERYNAVVDDRQSAKVTLTA